MTDAVRLALAAKQPREALDRLQQRALLAALVGIAGLAAGVFISPLEFFRSYLIAYIFLLGISLGSMALVMVHHLTGGAWGLLIRRLLESATRTLPLLLVLIVPILIGLSQLYPWARADVVAKDPILQQKALYLNVPFFLGRLVFYFAAWLGVAYLLNAWSAQQDRDPTVDDRRFRLLSAPGLLLYGLTVTFASVDLAMSLDPHWFSTIYGVLFMGGQALSAMAFAIAVLVFLGAYPPLSDVLLPSHLHDLGKLLFAFVMLWAYFSFSQFVIIWSADLPEEVPWYLERSTGIWQLVIVAIAVGHFALPFVLLLSRSLKRTARLLAPVAMLLVAMRYIDLLWLVKPSFGHAGLHWLDLAAVLGLGGLWLAFFVRELRTRALLPINDPYFEEALAHGHH